MLENKIQVSEIIEKLQNGETLDHCGIEIIPYLPIATKKQIINQIVLNSIIEVDGMKVLDSINKYIALNVSLVSFYSNVDGDFDDICEHGIIDYVTNKAKDEYYFISDMVDTIVDSECELHNSLSGMINRNLAILISKIPDEKSINKIMKSIPKVLNNISPENLELLKNITGIDKQAMPNREQRRKAEKE